MDNPRTFDFIFLWMINNFKTHLIFYNLVSCNHLYLKMKIKLAYLVFSTLDFLFQSFKLSLYYFELSIHYQKSYMINHLPSDKPRLSQQTLIYFIIIFLNKLSQLDYFWNYYHVLCNFNIYYCISYLSFSISMSLYFCSSLTFFKNEASRKYESIFLNLNQSHHLASYGVKNADLLSCHIFKHFFWVLLRL